jgi:hypothetical protein
MYIPLILSLFLTGCASMDGMKYHYSFSKRSLASEESSKIEVAKIELSLRDETLFPSGMDSTFMVVRLFDKEGNRITSIDPSDLTLSTNVDIKSKPFSFKQGIYKAQILPKVKSSSIKMRVDWQGRVLSDEVELKTSLRPKKDHLIPISHEYFESQSFGEVNLSRGSGTPENLSDGFNFDNIGNNKIVDTSKIPQASRTFIFDYIEHARQNIHVEVQDNSTGDDTESMRSLFMFFPRKQLPIVEQLTGTLNVTLSNGEKVIFQKNSKEILEGVWSEGKLVPHQFPDIKYKGTGILLRANSVGIAPQLTDEENNLDEVIITNGQTGQKCKRPKSDFWEPLNVTPIEFRFPKDEDFDQYLKSKCGFGLTRF